MSYDSVRDIMLLYTQQQTWSFDGTDWTVVPTATSPGPQGNQTMVYDSRRDRTVLLGPEETHDTWEFDGTDWSFVATPVSNRGVRYMAFDSQRGVAVAYLANGLFNGLQDETWEYDGAWHPISIGSSFPPSRRSTSLADSGNGVFMFAGFGLLGDFNDTYLDLGTSWLQIDSGPGSPPPRSRRGDPVLGREMAFDARRGRMVLLEGNGGSLDTWEFDGTSWAVRATPHSPPVRYRYGLAYDVARGRVVLYGGFLTHADPQRFDDTWEFDGTDWTQRVTSDQPPPLADVALAYDSKRERIVLVDPIGQQTWELDATGWRLDNTSSTPPLFGPMTYDAVRDRVVGITTTTDKMTGLPVSDDTWEFDGAEWALVDSGPLLPPKRNLMFDPIAARTVMIASDDEFKTTTTLVYTGSTWTPLPTAVIPPPREAQAMAYDTLRRRLVMFGGDKFRRSDQSSPPDLEDTWQLSFENASAGPDDCASATSDSDGDGLAGCADPDCAGRCAPACVPSTTICDVALPHCGDGECNPFLESAALCPEDCP